MRAQLGAGGTLFGTAEGGGYWAVTRHGRRAVVAGTGGEVPAPEPAPPGWDALAPGEQLRHVAGVLQAAERGPGPAELAAAPLLRRWRLAPHWDGGLRLADGEEGEDEGRPAAADLPQPDASPLLALGAGPGPSWARTLSGWHRLAPRGFQPDGPAGAAPQPVAATAELDAARRALAARRAAIRAAVEERLAARDLWGAGLV